MLTKTAYFQRVESELFTILQRKINEKFTKHSEKFKIAY